MAGYTTELKVGVLTVFTAAAFAWAVLRTDDRPDGAVNGYTLYLLVPNADGLYPSTQVKLAGVSVGSVKKITLVDGKAKLELEMAGDMKLPVDSQADLKSEGVLGDKFVRVRPGKEDALLHDGDDIQASKDGDPLQKLQDQATQIADNIERITNEVAVLMDDPMLRDKLELMLDDLSAVASGLRDITETNRAEIDIVARNLTELSATLKEQTERTSVSLDKEMSAIREVTQKIDDTLVHVNAIAARIDAGEGTVGRLVNDETTIDRINSAVAKVDDTLGDITSMKMEVTYDGQMYFGSNPDEPDIGFTQNPISGSMKNSLGLRILPRDDYGYIIGFTGHPYGNLSEEEHLYPDSGGSYSEVVRTGDYRLTFQFMKRWGPAALRLGVKESSGGVGADLFLARDRVTLSADIYDWDFGSWPVLDGTPNLTLGARVNPWRHVYLGGGLDNVIFDARNGYATGYFGFGFWFTDSDLKWVMSALPLP